MLSDQDRWVKARAEQDGVRRRLRMGLVQCGVCAQQWDASLTPLCIRCEQARLLAAPGLISEKHDPRCLPLVGSSYVPASRMSSWRTLRVLSPMPQSAEAGTSTPCTGNGTISRRSRSLASLDRGLIPGTICPITLSTACFSQMSWMIPMRTRWIRHECVIRFATGSWSHC